MARIVLEIDTASGVASIKNVDRALANTDRQVDRTEKRFSRFNNTISNQFTKLGGVVSGAFAGLATFGTIKSLVDISDQYTNLNSRLRTVTGSAEELQMVQDQLFQIAQRTGTAFSDNADAFARLAPALREAGAESSEILRITELVNKSLTVNGSSAAEAGAFMTQFAQAMGSGVLQGDELRSILESNATFARGLASALGTNIAGLREMGSQGRLTTDIIRQAFPQMATDIEDAFSNVELPVGRAFTEVQNAFKRAIFEGNNAAGVNASLAEQIQGIARAIEENGSAISGFFQILATGARIGVNVAGIIIKAWQILANQIRASFIGLRTNAELAFITLQRSVFVVFDEIAEKVGEILKIAEDLAGRLGIDIDLNTEAFDQYGDEVSRLADRQRQLIDSAQSQVRGIHQEQQQLIRGIGQNFSNLGDIISESIAPQKAVENAKAVENSVNDIRITAEDVGITFNEVTQTWEFGLDKINQANSEVVESTGKIKAAGEEVGTSFSKAADIVEDKMTNSFTIVEGQGRATISVLQQELDRFVNGNYEIVIPIRTVGDVPSGGAGSSVPSGGAAATGGGGSVNVNMNLPGSSSPVPMTTTQQGASQIINDAQRLNRRRS